MSLCAPVRHPYDPTHLLKEPEIRRAINSFLLEMGSQIAEYGALYKGTCLGHQHLIPDQPLSSLCHLLSDRKQNMTTPECFIGMFNLEQRMHRQVPTRILDLQRFATKARPKVRPSLLSFWILGESTQLNGFEIQAKQSRLLDTIVTSQHPPRTIRKTRWFCSSPMSLGCRTQTIWCVLSGGFAR